MAIFYSHVYHMYTSIIAVIVTQQITHYILKISYIKPQNEVTMTMCLQGHATHTS